MSKQAPLFAARATGDTCEYANTAIPGHLTTVTSGRFVEDL